MEAIFISGIFMSLFIVLLLLTKKNKGLTDKLLATWMAVIGIHLLGYYFNQLGLWTKYPHLIGITAPVPLLHGPLLFLYTLYSLRPDNKIRKADYLHFLPVMLAYLYMTKFFFFYSANEKIMVDSGEIADFRVFSIILLASILISGLLYAILAYRLTLKHENEIEENFSYNKGINLRWLRHGILMIGFMFLVATIVFVSRESINMTYPFNPEYIFYSIIIAFIFYIGYSGIKHENIFTSNPALVHVTSGEKPTAGKYSHSGLKADLATELHENLLQIMEKEKPYLDPRLTLTGLALKLDITPNQLSQVINQHEKVNFHDFVNRYRVEEFIRLASGNRKFSLLAIALDAGFNSKSSFNHIFKKCKGITPSKYLAGVLSPEEG